MDYLKHYNLLMESRKDLKRSKDQGYFESHHIIPKCKGGTDEQSNLVLLTAREHFLAHWLLWRHYRDSKSASMFNAMTRSSKGQERISSGRGYQEAKEAARYIHKGRKLSEEHKAKIKANNARTGKPNWNTGKKWKKVQVECSKCGMLTSKDVNRRWHEDNCKVAKIKELLKLHNQKEVAILMNVSPSAINSFIKRHNLKK